jgi:hypothetical protein
MPRILKPHGPDTPKDAADCILDNIQAKKKEKVILDGKVHLVDTARYGGDAGRISLMMQNDNKSSKHVTVIFDNAVDTKLQKSISAEDFFKAGQKIHHKALCEAHHAPGSAAKKGDPVPQEAEYVDLVFHWEHNKTGVPNSKLSS